MLVKVEDSKISLQIRRTNSGQSAATGTRIGARVLTSIARRRQRELLDDTKEKIKNLTINFFRVVGLSPDEIR